MNDPILVIFISAGLFISMGYLLIVFVNWYRNRLRSKKNENPEVAIPVKNKSPISLKAVFFALIVMQLIFSGGSFDVTLLVEIGVSIVCYILISGFSKKKESIIATFFRPLLGGFFIAWVASWAIIFLSFVAQGGKLQAGGSGEAIGALVLLTGGSLLGFVVGSIDTVNLIIKKNRG